MASAHETAREGDDREAATQGLKRRLASGPIQGIQEHIRGKIQAQEITEVQLPGETAELAGIQSMSRKTGFKPGLHSRGGVMALVADENKMRAGHCLCDAGIDIVVLRQIFENGLGGQENEAIFRDP